MSIIAPLRALVRSRFPKIDGMTPAERAVEAWGYLRSRTPIVTRRTMLRRERNAFELGMDCGAYTGKSSSFLHGRPRPAERHLKVVSA